MYRVSQVTLLIGILGQVLHAYGQFDTPLIDASIGSNEYGSHVDGQNQETHDIDGQTWLMTWDNTNLYIAITNASVSQAAIVYIDHDPIDPVNAGSNSDGNLTGFNYDNTNFAELQFRADFVAHFKATSREYRTADGSSNWSGATTGFGSYSDDGSNLRELAIPWSAITGGGRPASFNWFGYVESGSGNGYGAMPEQNHNSGFIGTSARWVRYYNIGETADGSSTQPFSRNCYVFNSTSDVTGFGGLEVFNFTMNDAGRSITRGTNGVWDIAGKMLIHNGNIDFGAVQDDCTVNGNLQIKANGILSLSSFSSADLYVGGDFLNNGSFNCNQRGVFFNGNSINQQQRIGGSSGVTIDYLFHQTTGGIQLDTVVTISEELDLNSTAGAYQIYLNDNDLIIGADGEILFYDETSYAVTNGIGSLQHESIGLSGTKPSADFPIGPSGTIYAPVLNVSSVVSGSNEDFAWRVCNDLVQEGGCSGGTTITSNYVNLTWILGGNYTNEVNADFQWNAAQHLTGFDPNNVGVYVNPSGTWVQQGATGTASGTDPYTFGGSSFNHPPETSFGIGSPSLLPVHWLSFTAFPEENNVSLRWEVAEFPGTARYLVERSFDGIQFQEIDSVLATGASEYQWKEDRKYQETYYRIVSEDWDGKRQFSSIELVPERDNLVRIYPNPTNGPLFIDWRGGTVNLVIQNMLGQVIHEQVLTTGNHPVEVPPGMYLVRVGDLITEKVLVYE